MGFKVLSNEVNYTDDGGSFDDQPVATLTVSSTYARDAAAAAVLAKAEREAAEAAKIAAETAKTNAETAETNAETAETNSETAETNAASSASASVSSATSSANSATTATTKASEASASASTATTKASEASSSATDAANSASSASASKDAALAALDNFDDRYLGQKSSNPSVDNDGDALVAGALYFNTTDDSMKVYEGSTWVAAYASLAGTLLTTNNLSDVASATTSRSNLGLGTAATTAATAYATAAQGTTANNALPKAGGTLTGDINMGNNSLLFGDFRIQRDGNNLIFKHNTNVIALLNSLGNFKVIGDLDSNHAFNYIYTIGGFNPDLVIDFKNSYYKTGGTDSTLSGVVTHARAGNATMVDSNGKIKWAPHNLLIRSEETNVWGQAGSGGVVVNNAVAPDGTTTAATFTISSTNFQRYILSSGAYTAGDKITYSFWARSGTVTTLPFGINGGTNGANNNIFSSIAVTSTWNLFEFEFTVLGNDNSLYYMIGDQNGNPVNCQLGDVEIWHPHAYRSDLGGMVNNPAQPTGFETYVPTTSSAVYAPRVGHHIYNGSAWVNEGILHESEARTNLVTYSEDFTHSSWTKTSASISSNASTSPDGSLSADAIVPTAVNTNHFLAGNAGITSGQSYSFSVFAKAGTQDWLRLAATSALFVNPNHVWFNLASGTVGTASTGVTAAITNVGNGWYLCEWKAVASANGNPQFFIVSESGDGTFGYLGNGSEEAIFVWGAQIEVGATPSSYIPTSGSTVTRAAETLTVPAANLPYSSTNMSIQMDGKMTYADDGSADRFIQWGNQGDDEIRLNLEYGGSQTGSPNFIQRAGGVIDILSDVNAYSPNINVPFNIASRHGSSFMNGAVDGTALTANTTPTALPNLSSSTLSLGFDFMGTIAQFRVWDEDLGDTGIATASAPSTEPSLQLTFDGSSTSSFTVLDWSE